MVELYINGQPQPLSEKQNTRTQRETLPTFSLQQAYDFINCVDFNDIRFILDAARLNSALAAEGKTKKYGLNINGTFSDAVKKRPDEQRSVKQGDHQHRRRFRCPHGRRAGGSDV
ncbi:Putative inner membrane protein [Klebsiella pneumoniae IS22]|nr:Putative inner membrane protein [Klebsiella pneumoniae IS22]